MPVVAAEDTRRTRILLDHLGVRPRVLGYHAHSGPGAGRAVLAALAEGRDVALVTDAGTPGVSDPGAALVAEAREAGFVVVPLPGPSAVATALSAAGLPADRYVFLGFLPRKGGERTRLLERIAKEEWTTVLFEAPGRVGELLADLRRACGPDRRGVVARELTKLHEEFRVGTLGELAEVYADADPRGECTVIVEGAGRVATEDHAERAERLARRLLESGRPRKEIAAMLVDIFGLARNQAYRLVTALPDP